ncbi:MAG: nucleotidyltransferase domain-containing protein [Betaproteobacteria bacterium]
MKRQLQIFKEFIEEAKDPAYFQDTFNFTVLISMDKNRGGSRDETKNDIRALPEVLTVTLIEKEKGGVQKDLGNTYLSTLKIHIRRPRDTSKELMMKRVVKQIARLKGVSVLRYKERKPKQRRKAFYGPGSYTKRVQNVNEGEYWQSSKHKSDLKKDFKELTTGGPQKKGGAPFNRKNDPDWESAPPGAAGGLEEALLDEAMKTAADLPEDIVVVVDKQNAPNYYKIYYALQEDLRSPLKAGDLDRMERGVGVYGVLSIQLGRDFPYEGNYVVESVKAADGYGPLLYDVALETVGKAGLKPDIKSISDDASAVWKFYDTQRDDVQGELLVMDIDQYHTVMPKDRADKPGENEHLAQVYRKKSRSTTKELQDLNKLVQIYTPPPAERKSRYKEKDLSRFDRLREDILISVGNEDDLATFEMQPEFQQKIWDGDERIRPGVKGALMDIVDEFVERLDLDAEIKDIIVTGSLANYNWSKFSDIDLHILIDFKEVNDNEELVKRFFDAVRSNWNKTHDIKVKGHEVELYVQDENEPHVSTGVYSLMNDKWLVKPNKVKPFIDKKTAKKKAADIEREVDKVASVLYDGNHEAALDKAAYLKEKIKTMRQAGLEKAGVFSPENLAFKMLRRSEALSKLHDVYIKAYDQALSLDQ